MLEDWRGHHEDGRKRGRRGCQYDAMYWCRQHVLVSYNVLSAGCHIHGRLAYKLGHRGRRLHDCSHTTVDREWHV